MARQTNILTDRVLNSGDRFTGIDQLGNTMNFSLADVQRFHASSGLADAARSALTWRRVGVNDNVTTGTYKLDSDVQAVYPFASITTITVSEFTHNGQGASLLLEEFEGGTVKLNSIRDNDRSYGLFTLDIATPPENGIITLTLTYLDGGNGGLDFNNAGAFLSLSPIGVGGSGSGGRGPEGPQGPKGDDFNATLFNSNTTTNADGSITTSVTYNGVAVFSSTVNNGTDGEDGTSFEAHLLTFTSVKVDLVTTVTIAYDGTTIGNFTVTDGTDGQDGRDGGQGIQGAQGIFDLEVYRFDDSGVAPSTPTGGSFNPTTGAFTAPSSPVQWYTTVDAALTAAGETVAGGNVFESRVSFNPAMEPTILMWSVPFHIGAQGASGPQGPGYTNLAVDADGNISATEVFGATDFVTTNIRGPQGTPGAAGTAGTNIRAVRVATGFNIFSDGVNVGLLADGQAGQAGPRGFQGAYTLTIYRAGVTNSNYNNPQASQFDTDLTFSATNGLPLSWSLTPTTDPTNTVLYSSQVLVDLTTNEPDPNGVITLTWSAPFIQATGGGTGTSGYIQQPTGTITVEVGARQIVRSIAGEFYWNISGGTQTLSATTDFTNSLIWEDVNDNRTAAQLKIAYESNADTNAFDDAAVTKLSGIEALAEVNRTAAELKTDYESNADTNALTDAEKARLSEVISEHSLTVTYQRGDFVFQAAGNSKGIYESSINGDNLNNAVTNTSAWQKIATFYTTDGDIKVAYENNADTNVFTDAEKTKLQNTSLITLLSEQTITPVHAFTQNFTSITGQTSLIVGRIPADLEINPTTYTLTAVHPSGGTSTTVSIAATSYDASTGTLTLASAITGLALGDNNLTFTKTGTITVLESDAVSTDIEGDLTVNRLLRLSNVSTIDSGLAGSVWNDRGTLVLSGFTAATQRTNAEIKTAYESNANTNAFTDADETRLDNSILANQGIVYQNQPGQSEAVTPPLIPIRGLVKSNGSLDGYQDRIYQNVSGRPLSVGGDGYITSIGNAPTTSATLEEGVASGDWEIYVNAGRYDATNNPNGHLGIENAELFGVTEDAPDWSGLLAYTVDQVVNFRNNIYKRRTQNIIATTGVSIVPGFLELVSFKNNAAITGALGYADTFVFDPNLDAPALTSGIVYRFTIGSGSTQYVIDADPGSTDVTANVGSLYGNGLQTFGTLGRIWRLRLLTPTGTIAPGYTIVSVGDPSIEDNVYTTAQQVAAQTALLALLAGKPIGTAIDSLDEGDQISFGGSPNTAPSEDVSWELISNATLAASRYDLIAGQEVTFHQIPVDETTISLDRDDPRRQLFEGFLQGLITVPESELDRTITNGTQAVNLPNGAADEFSVGDTIIGRGASFPGIFVGKVVANITGDTTSQVRFRLTSLRQDDSEAIVALDDTTVIPGLGGLTRVGDIIQVARLEDVSPVTSIDEFNTTLIQNDSDQLPLGTNFEPSAQVTYLTSFAPRENVEYNGNFYFYIGPGSHADFLHDAALRPQEFTNADFVPGNNKLNWVTYNEYVNDLSEADRAYSERVAATRDVTLHAQVRREIEAAKQDVLLTLSDRDSEREDQLVSLRPIWRLANTRYDDGSRFRRNVLYNAIRPDSTYTLTAGNRENTRGYNVFGTTGTVTFNGIIAVGAATVSGMVITVPTPSGTALTQAQIATIEYGSVGFRNPINLLTRNGLVSYSASATALTLTFSSASLASFTHDEFLSASGRLVIINTTQTTVNRKEASLCWVEFTEGSTRFTGEGLVIDNDGVIGRQELISALDTTSPEDNNGVVLGIENSDTTVHYFNSAKPWDDDFFTATGDQAVHCTVSAGNTGATGTAFNDTRVTSLGAAQRFAWSTRTYEDNPEDYFDLDPSANEYIIDNYNFAARAGGLVVTGALLEPAVKSYSGFIWIASNASNMSNESLHPQNRVVQTPFRNVNTIDLSQFQSSFNANNVLETVAGVTQIQTLKMYGLTDTTIAAINSGNRVDFRFTLNEPGTESPPIYQLSTVGTTPYRTATSEIDVTFVNTTSQGVVALPELSRFAWQLDARAAGTITRPTLATEAYTATNITAGTAVQGAFLGPHGILTNESRYFQDSTKQWAAVTSTAREFNNSLFSRGEVISGDTVVRGSDGTYYKWTFRGRANSFDVGVIIRYDNVQVTRDAAGRFSSSSIDAVGNTSIYDPASVDATTFIDGVSTTSTSIASLNDLNNLFQVNSVHPFTVEYDGYFNLAAGESATNASIIIGGTTTTGTGVTNHAELNRFVLMDPTALHAQATLVAGGSTNAQAIRDAHAFNNLWSVLEVDEVYPQYRSTEHNAIGAYQETTLQYSVDASRLQGTSIENTSPGVGQVLRAVEIPDPADTANVGDTIIQWQPGYAASTIPDHRTIPVTTSGADPFDLVDWQLTFGSGDDRVFEALAQTGSTGTIDTTLINLGEVLTVTFADGSIEQGHVFGGTTSTTRLFGQLTRRPVSSLLTNNVATATIRYYGDTAAESYVASPLTVNSDNEVIYKGNELASGNLQDTDVVDMEPTMEPGQFQLTQRDGTTRNIISDHWVLPGTIDSVTWTTGTPPDAYGLNGQFAYHPSDKTLFFRDNGAWGTATFPTSTVATTFGDFAAVIDASLTGNNENSVLQPSGQGQNIAIRANGNGGVILEDVTTINGDQVATSDVVFKGGGYINAWITGTVTASSATFGTFTTYSFETYTNIQGDPRTWIFLPTLTITGTGVNAAFVTGDGLWTRLINDSSAENILEHPSTFLL